MKIEHLIKEEIEIMSIKGYAIPRPVVEAFTDLGDMQRNRPEDIMLRIQHTNGGGVLNPVVEHAGDLIHRMTHGVHFGYFGQDTVSEKTLRLLRSLRHDYGFEREMEDNFRANAKFFERSVDEQKEVVFDLLEQYADAHKRLPVYNWVQYKANRAAIEVGRRNWLEAERWIEALDRDVRKSREEWNELVLDHYMNDRGRVYEFDRRPDR